METGREPILIETPQMWDIHPRLMLALQALGIRNVSIHLGEFSDGTPMDTLDGEGPFGNALIPALIIGRHARTMLDIAADVGNLIGAERRGDSRTPYARGEVAYLFGAADARSDKPSKDRNGRLCTYGEGLFADRITEQVATYGRGTVCATFEPHSPYLIEGFLNQGIRTVYALTAMRLFAEVLKGTDILVPGMNCGIIAPDIGALQRAFLLSQFTGVPIIGYFEKDRRNCKVASFKFHGIESAEGWQVIVPDDVWGTGGTMIDIGTFIKSVLKARRMISAVSLVSSVPNTVRKVCEHLREEDRVIDCFITTNSSQFALPFIDMQRDYPIYVADALPVLVTAARAMIWPTPENLAALAPDTFLFRPPEEILAEVRKISPYL